jgi:hypothetical protein
MDNPFLRPFVGRCENISFWGIATLAYFVGVRLSLVAHRFALSCFVLVG